MRRLLCKFFGHDFNNLSAWCFRCEKYILKEKTKEQLEKLRKIIMWTPDEAVFSKDRRMGYFIESDGSKVFWRNATCLVEGMVSEPVTTDEEYRKYIKEENGN